MTVEELMNDFTFTELTEDVLAECEHFSCGISDLDEYFRKDVMTKALSRHLDRTIGGQ